MMNEMGDGWEDDDDDDEYDLDSLSDNVDDEAVEQTTQSTLDENRQQDTHGAIPIGQGFLAGRLSRFIEAVTQPEAGASSTNNDTTGMSSNGSLGLAASEVGDDGWQEDDEELDELLVNSRDDDDEDNGWQQEDEEMLLQQETSPESPHAAAATAATTIVVEPELTSCGWEDDDVLEGLQDASLQEDETQQVVHEDQQPALPTAAWNEPTPLAPNEAEPSFSGGGWDDEDALDVLDNDGDDESSRSLHEESQIQQDELLVDETLHQQQQPVLVETTMEPSSGWEMEEAQQHTMDGLNDDALRVQQHESQQVENKRHDEILPEQSTLELSQSGWEDDALDGCLDDSSLQEVHVPTEASSALRGLDDTLPTERAPSLLPPPSPTFAAATSSEEAENVWEDDDDLNVDLVDDNDLAAANGDSIQGGERQPLPPAAVCARQDAAVVVDHVPTQRTRACAGESMVTNADESTVLRENARDEEEFVSSDDYGPVVDHLPSEHSQHDQIARTVSTVVPESCTEVTGEEERVEAMPVSDSNARNIIDQVPDDVSNVSSGGEDSTASVDGDDQSDMRMPDSVVRSGTSAGEYGPVVDRMPSEHSFPHASRTTSTALPSTFNESLDERSNAKESRPTAANQQMEVDHVPDDVSNVPTDNDDSTASVDGGESSDLPVQEGPDQLDSADGDFGPVVDHMPSLHSSVRADGTVSAIAPPSVNNEIAEDDNEGGIEETTSSQAVASTQRTPGFVDHVPDDGSRFTNRNSTLAAATEMSVASELSNTLGDEALESDVDAKEENYGPVVDHTPLQQSIHSRRNPSVRVQAPIEEIDEDDIDEEQYFGPVVDHTPTVQVSTVSSVTGSMAVAAPPSEVDDDSDDRSDTVDENGGERSNNDHYDDDTLDAPTSSVVSATKIDGPTLVDHVPRRPGSRPTDASTLVVVDPSEVSTVGDMTYEEQQYGPVVDHTPPARSLIHAAAENSTAVAATTSVGPDDTLVDTLVDDMLDEGGVSRRRDENDSEADDAATLPTLDNQPPMETNVVDHVPEVGPPMFRIDSVLSTAPTQSVLSPDETRDSEFGLVVDHLPRLLLPSPPSRGSMAVLAPPSVFDDDVESGTVEEEMSMPAGEQPASERTTEEAKVVVDHLPPVRDANSRMRPSDSTITVRSHISDDDTLEGIARPDRFGPVVDQLPAAPVQTSLGGSTTGALATLSEVNDDTIVDEDTRGWDYDEQELESIQDSEREMGENGRQPRTRPSSRGLSVTFSSYETVKTVQTQDEGIGNNGLFSSIANETQYFDAEEGDSPSKSVNETQESQYFDPESGEMEVDAAQNTSLIRSDSVRTNRARCVPCEQAKGATCRCIQSILQANQDENAMVISVVTKEGLPVEIDFKKLLENETTKRLLLEKEVEACHSTIDALETSLSEAKAIDGTSSANSLCESTAMNGTGELASAREELIALASQNKELTTQLVSLSDKAADNKSAIEEYAARESASQAEIENLRRACEEARSESQQLASVGDELALEVDQIRNANEEVLIELGRQKGQCEELEEENKRLDDERSSMERKLSDMSQEKSDLLSRKSALEDEILHCRRALEESSVATSSEADLRTQLSSLQIEAASKSAECEQIRSQVDQTHKRLQESEARNFAQMKESTRAQRLHEGEMKKLKEQLHSLQIVVDDREASLQARNDKILEMESNGQLLKAENESLKRTINETRSEFESKTRQEQVSSQEKMSQVRALEIKLKLLSSDKAKASSDLALLQSQLKESLHQASAAEALKEEHSSLQSTLAVNKETINSLQEQVEALSEANKEGTDQMENLVASISDERDSLRRSLQSKEKEMQTMQSDLRAFSHEKTSFEGRMEALATKCGELEAIVEDLQSKVVENELELAEKDRTCESLRESIAGASETSQLREEHEREVSGLRNLVSENEQRLNLLQSQLESQVNAIRDRDEAISRLQQQRTEAEELAATITVDRDNALARVRDFDAELARMTEECISLKDANELSNDRVRELGDSLDSIARERDDALQERELLQEDNEELLVQLGLVKQQLDAEENGVEELRRIAKEKGIAAKHTEERLRDAEEYIAELTRSNSENRPDENGTHEPGQLAALEQAVDELTVANEDLKQKVDDLSSTNAYIDAQVTSLRDEKMELLNKIAELEELRQASGSDAAIQEERYQSQCLELEEQCRHFEELCKLKDEQLEHSVSKMHEAQAASESLQIDITERQKHIAQLQGACAERDKALHDRDRALEDLTLEVEGLRSQAPRQTSGTVDFEALQRRLQNAERSSQHFQDRLREMETVLEQSRRELKVKTEKLAETESMLFDRDLELDLQLQDRGSTEEELRKQLHEMEALLTQRNEQIQDMFAREQAMERSVGESQLETTGAHFRTGPLSTNAQSVSEETLQLRSEVSALHRELQSSTSNHDEREKRARLEVDALNEAILRKEEQIESLEKQLRSLSEEFSSSQDQLVSKETDYRRLSIELEEARGDQLQSTRTATSQVLEPSSKEQAESVDNMRSHIIMLAQALERSETQRASAIERLLSERKASADSLRRLGESVKRFYSSLSYRDA